MAKILILFIFVTLAFSTIFAQLDPTFGTNGVTRKNVNEYDRLIKSFILPDGKILVLQRGEEPNSNFYRFNLVKFNANGSVDTAFGNNGVVLLTLPFSDPITRYIYDAVRQTDGKIVLVGVDNGDAFVARIDDNGSLDTSFGNGGFHRPNFFNREDVAHSIFQQADGKLVVFGSADDNVSGKYFIIRYDLNGSPDNSFGDTGDGYILHTTRIFKLIGIQSNGKFIVESDSTISRFNANGTFDNTFNLSLAQLPTTNSSRQFAVAADDKIIIASSEDTAISLFRDNTDLSVRRYNANGSIDSTFGSNGVVKNDVASFQNDIPQAIAFQTNGKIVIAATTSVDVNNRSLIRQNQLSLMRLNSNGSLDGKTIVTSGGNDNAEIFVLPNDNIVDVSNSFSPSYSSDIVVSKVMGIPMSNYRFKGIPFAFTGDGKSDVSVFRPNNTTWYKGLSDGVGERFGLSTDILVSSDFLGDFRSDLAVFRPTNGTWYIAKPDLVAAQNFLAVQWGTTGDIPVPADFDGDGKSDISVFRPSNGVWYIRPSDSSAPRFTQWGTNGDKPVTGDFDGDGFGDIAVWRPSDGVWYILKSSNSQPTYLQFGASGDIPIQEDYDGDGKTDIGVWRPSNGVWYIYKSSDSTISYQQFGIASDIPTPGDYDGDGKIDLGVWRSSQGRWYSLQSSNGSLGVASFGLSTDLPIPGRY